MYRNNIQIVFLSGVAARATLGHLSEVEIRGFSAPNSRDLPSGVVGSLSVPETEVRTNSDTAHSGYIAPNIALSILYLSTDGRQTYILDTLLLRRKKK